MPIKLKKKRKPHKPHCKVCRLRMAKKDWCYACRRHVCPGCEIDHDCEFIPGV